MKNIITAIVYGFIVSFGIQNVSAQEPSMRTFNENIKAVQLKKGTMQIFDYGETKVHVYETKGFFNTHAFFIEKKGKGVLIETPPMKDNYKELVDYIVGLGYKDIDVMVSYHLIGKHFFDTDKLKFNHIYSNQESLDYMKNSGNESLSVLKKVSGQDLDETTIVPTDLLKAGAQEISGIPFIITPTGFGFDVEMPAIKAVHLHMVGHDNHTMIFNTEFIDTVIKELTAFQEKGYTTYFSSHSAPETSGDVTIKINYLKEMKALLSAAKNEEEFIQKMDKAYPNFGWRNYLLGSAKMLYQKK
ncbi:MULTISPECIES: hypothetical protein [unclassified Flavobacterium]|uniref:hypothetical protein n=1 Tax=unclassified Flavobacterium TaxID=196869 RepID=UPI001571407A|nr:MULTISPECIES: hypothetical protein [unclassified Flavobacterium]MCW2118055.1 hypothetical protein [Flavobacterium sp. 7A]NRT10573.1 hypothetical protein [Flavobacterium sp. 14A]